MPPHPKVDDGRGDDAGPSFSPLWSVTQGPIALSSAEAEYYAMAGGTTKALGFQTSCREVGIRMSGPITLHTDS